MKFTIQNLVKSQINTKFGVKNKFQFVSNGQQVSAWEKKGFTDQFAEGYSFDADLGQPYKGVLQIEWPKASNPNIAYTPSNAQMTDAIKLTLERIEKKVDRILQTTEHRHELDNGKPSTFSAPKDIPQMPFEDSPFPRDEDQY